MKPPTIQQLVDSIGAYNVAREAELRAMPPGGFPKEYKNDLMDSLYDCALAAARVLKPAIEKMIVVKPRK